MKVSRLRVPLGASPEQAARLRALQRAFAQACNLLAPIVREHRCWNRVALHHLAYRQVRQALPALGSQMVCNAIYAVCRAARLVFQHPKSPFHVARWGDRPLPLLRFADNCPVYFDRHTLSVRNGRVSLFTLDGRIHLDLALCPQDESVLHSMRLLEVVLARREGGMYELTFLLQGPQQADPTAAAKPIGDPAEWPEYLMVEETA